jgi:hypothetical protein
MHGWAAIVVQVLAADHARQEVERVRREKDQELAAAVARAKSETEMVRGTAEGGCVAARAGLVALATIVLIRIDVLPELFARISDLWGGGWLTLEAAFGVSSCSCHHPTPPRHQNHRCRPLPVTMYRLLQTLGSGVGQWAVSWGMVLLCCCWDSYCWP